MTPHSVQDNGLLKFTVEASQMGNIFPHLD